jgi:hypothetical protein
LWSVTPIPNRMAVSLYERFIVMRSSTVLCEVGQIGSQFIPYALEHNQP